MKLNSIFSARSSIPHQTKTSEASRNQWIFLVRIFLLVLLLIVTYKIVRAGFYGLSVYNGGRQILELRSDGDVDDQDFVRAATTLQSINRSGIAMERELRFFAPLLRGANFIPRIGPTLAAAPEFLIAGREMVALANDSMRILLPTIETRPDSPVTEVLLPAMAANADQFVHLGGRVETAQQALDRIDPSGLLPALSQPVAQAQALLDLMAVGLRMAPALPHLLGMDQPRTYLLLVQNNHELRATGGFISALGQVNIDNGRLGEIQLQDSYDVARDDIDHPWAPDPMRRYMNIDLVFIRDANWSPDFPTSATLVHALYEQDTGVETDGVVSIDLRAVQLLIGALEPVHIPGTAEAITGDNLIDKLKQFWDQPLDSDATLETDGKEWWEQRKDFMPTLAQAALNRLETGDVNFLALADAIKQALDEHAIQIWLRQPDAAAEMARMNWDGAIRPAPKQDYLALIDTNMGYNKVDSVLSRAIDYHVTWPDGPDAPATATAVVTYRHPVQAEDHVCDQTPRYGKTYDDMTKRCYFNYVRLYVPGGSELLEIEGVEQDSVNDQIGERNTHVFAGYFTMLPGAEHQVSFTYRLPAHITPETYGLTVQRQSGTGLLTFQGDVGSEEVATTIESGRFHWRP